MLMCRDETVKLIVRIKRMMMKLLLLRCGALNYSPVIVSIHITYIEVAGYKLCHNWGLVG